ncbi:hypothetical protein GCM10027037_19310 [Mucilaginibacter koreensis]
MTGYDKREQLIQAYIDAYNNFDIEGMMAGLKNSMEFKNITGGVVDLHLQGLEAFKQQAIQAVAFFNQRQQTVTDYKHEPAQTEVTIDYQAIVAADLPNGLKQGDLLQLSGTSVFTFDGGKISGITDIG